MSHQMYEFLPYLKDDQVEARKYSELCDFPDFTQLKTIDYKVKALADTTSFRCVQDGYLSIMKNTSAHFSL